MYSVRIRSDYTYHIDAENLEEATKKAMELRDAGDYGDLTLFDIGGYEVQYTVGGNDENS